MRGLLLKDFYTMLKQGKSLIFLFVLSVVFTFLLNTVSYAAMMVSMGVLQLTFSTFAYDNSAKWDTYAVSLPLKRSYIVFSKYILLGAGAVASLVFGSLVIYGAKLLSSENFNYTESIVQYIAVVITYLMSCAIAFPFVFKFGAEKVRTILMVCLIIPVILIVMVFNMLQFFMPAFLEGITLQLVLIIIAIVLVLIITGSIYISVKIYNKKEF